MVRRISTVTVFISIALVVWSSHCVAQTLTPKEVDAACGSSQMATVADSVAASFDKHQFVFISSTHGSRKPHDFLLCLISRPAFQQRVTDVLVEWANPVHQSAVDRYLLKLEQVPEHTLRQAWFDTDRPQLWARLSQIPEFYAGVRAINTRLEPAKRIRVLGGCEPVNWAVVRTQEELALQPFKNNWAAHVITEHFAIRPEQRLLVVYGDGHIHHNGGPMMANLEAKVDRSQLFVVGTIRDLGSGDAERVAKFGDTTRPFFISAAGFPSTQSLPGDLFYATAGPLRTYIDALVYLGSDADRDLSNSIELTEAQKAEIARREAIQSDFQRLLQLRLANRNVWFRTHPDDIPKRP